MAKPGLADLLSTEEEETPKGGGKGLLLLEEEPMEGEDELAATLEEWKTLMDDGDTEAAADAFRSAVQMCK